MNKRSKHNIQRQRISIGFEKPENRLGLQNRVAELFYERVQPRMETLFDEMADENHIITIENLEIDCGIIKGKHWEDEWVDAVLFHLKQELNAVQKSRIPPDQVNNPFFFFLETGHLPWNSNIKMIEELEESILLDQIFFIRLKKLMSESVLSSQRLGNQFSDFFLKRLINAYLKLEGKPIVANNKGEQASHIPGNNLRDIVHEIFADNKKQAIPLKNEFFDKVNNSVELKPEKTNQLNEIYISNAGLVVLHPFLPALFEKLQMIKYKRWISEEAQQKAVLVTEFLMKGEEEFPEFNLSLNKIICGMDLRKPMVTESPISVEVIASCEELLREVIKHWSALKHTGIDSLRETFLKRNGKLKQVDNGWLLLVEQMGVDVLLNKLPWGIGIVKLPWMEEILHVEWT